MSSTYASTSTYSSADVETVFRRFRADILMIAESSAAITRAKAEEYAHDAEYLSKRGYLKKIDVTLISKDVEHKAVVYQVNESSGDTVSQRPGGVLWPRIEGAWIRITIFYTNAYTDAAREQTQSKLKIKWTTSAADTSHATLTEAASRSYASNGFGLDRQDLS